jgi:vacuolar protein sorting-associated protein VTA1
MATPANDKAFLYALFDKAEQSKAAFGIEQIEDSKQIICENFALSVFSKADEEDRKGMTSRTTAMSFYAAAIFLDILDQFGPADEEISEKRVYAKWRSAEIMKALKEGRTPDPPAANTNVCDITILNSIINHLPV